MWCITDCEPMTWSLWNLMRPFFFVTIISIASSSCISFNTRHIRVLCGYLTLLTTATSGFKIISGSRNQRFWFFEKIRIKEPSILVISKNLKEPVVFMKEAAMKSWFYGCEINQNKHDYIPEPVLWFFRITVMNTQHRGLFLFLITIQHCTYTRLL